MQQDLERENQFYRKCLQDPIHGEIGRNYLKSRGITDETIEKWEIGWSPWNCIPSFYKDSPKKFWMKHWGRITFPIRDQHGKMVSISGRLVLQLKNVPKYDHYPFSARRILFGLWQNKDTIRELDRAIITEGQLDVITSWQKGFRIVTSSFGAHGSLDHLSLLARYTKNIDILYDADAAGAKGMEGIKKLSSFGDLEIKFQNPFSKGDDLDSWLNKHSVEELWKILDKTKIDTLKERLARMKSRL